VAHGVEEMDDFVSISSALYINVGTLSAHWVEGMRRGALRANALNKPWVLDPVGCGATAFRTKVRF
jgi:hydroxyethylthiazole kinase